MVSILRIIVSWGVCQGAPVEDMYGCQIPPEEEAARNLLAFGGLRVKGFGIWG